MLSEKSIKKKFIFQLILASVVLIAIFSIVLYSYIKISILDDITSSLRAEASLILKEDKLKSPFSKKPLAKLKTLHPNTSISTSGTYRRYIKDKNHHHLINPKSKQQGKSFISITLITQQNNTLIDAMATAIGVMPFREAMKFLNDHKEIGYVLIQPNGHLLHKNLENLAKFSKF